MAISAFRVFIRIILRILLLPVQAVLTVLIAMVHFASGVLGLVCGIIGGLFVLLSGRHRTICRHAGCLS